MKRQKLMARPRFLPGGPDRNIRINVAPAIEQRSTSKLRCYTHKDRDTDRVETVLRWRDPVEKRDRWLILKYISMYLVPLDYDPIREADFGYEDDTEDRSVRDLQDDCYTFDEITGDAAKEWLKRYNFEIPPDRVSSNDGTPIYTTRDIITTFKMSPGHLVRKCKILGIPKRDGRYIIDQAAYDKLTEGLERRDVQPPSQVSQQKSTLIWTCGDCGYQMSSETKPQQCKCGFRGFKPPPPKGPI